MCSRRAVSTTLTEVNWEGKVGTWRKCQGFEFEGGLEVKEIGLEVERKPRKER